MFRGVRGARVRTRGGLSRGSYSQNTRGSYSQNTNTYKARSDLNTFEVLSSLPQDGDVESLFSGTVTGTDDDGFTLIRKRQRRSTGGTSNEHLLAYNPDPYPDPNIMSNFEGMGTDDKLSAIFSTLNCNQNRIKHIEHSVRALASLNGRMERVETVVHSYNDRLRLLEYKSIDLEARSRRNNLLFKGFPESRDENCGRTVINFLETKLGMDELPSIERAHRLGRFNSEKGPRPIIVAFSFYKDTEDILSSARVLKGTSYGISRDYPQEITRARQKLWPQYKAARENPLNRVTIGYPAKLIVNGVVICDLFPEWNSVNNGSRVSVPQRGSDQMFSQTNFTTPTYAEVVNSVTSGQYNSSQPDVLTDREHVQSPVLVEENMDTNDVNGPQSSPNIFIGAVSVNSSDTDLLQKQPSVEHKDTDNAETVTDTVSLDDTSSRTDENLVLGERLTQTVLCSSPSTLADNLIRSSSSLQSSGADSTSQDNTAPISKPHSPDRRTARSASRHYRSHSRTRPRSRTRSCTPIEKKSDLKNSDSNRTPQNQKNIQ